MPSRRDFLRTAGVAGALGTYAVGAAYFDVGTVRTRLGGGFGTMVDLAAPADDDDFVPPSRVGEYVERMRERYGEAGLPWIEPEAFAGQLVGAYAQHQEIVPGNRQALQDAAVLIHRISSTRYRLRLWSAARLLDESYDVGPWGLYREDPGFTWLEQSVEPKYNDELSSDRSLAVDDAGRVEVADGAVTVPDGRYRMGTEQGQYRSRWEGFHRGTVPLVGACEARFATGAERTFVWDLSNGVGIRTPL